jgi:hypothetical protein
MNLFTFCNKSNKNYNKQKCDNKRTSLLKSLIKDIEHFKLSYKNSKIRIFKRPKHRDLPNTLKLIQSSCSALNEFSKKKNIKYIKT